MGSQQAKDTSGYKAWLALHARADEAQRKREAARYDWLAACEQHDTIAAAVSELRNGIRSILGQELREIDPNRIEQGIVIGTFDGNERIRALCGDASEQLGAEGFAIRASEGLMAIGANTPSGVLYGVFHLLRLLALGELTENLSVMERPANGLRMINQWDNIDGSIERGYAGQSIFTRMTRSPSSRSECGITHDCWLP